MPELLQDYQAQHGRLVAQARELERLRQQVRSSAEREAAAIVTNARRNVRQVLLEARRELLVLVAQLQAVGCDQPASASERLVMEAELSAVSSRLAEPTVDPPIAEEPVAAGGIAAVARRDVREVLLEAQAELLALAEEAKELRARIARQQGGAPEPVVAPEPTPAPEASEPVWEPAAAPAEDFHAEAPQPPAPPPEYVPLAAGMRIWISVAAAVAFAAVGVSMYVSSGGDVAAHREDARADGAAPSASESATAAPGAAAASAPALDPSKLSVTIDVRRPAWIRTTVDGRSDVGRLFNPGEKRTVTARSEIVMRAGDAGAVLVSVNGSEPRALGGDGRVITRRFGRLPAPRPEPPLVQTVLAAEASPPAPLSGTPAADIGTTGTVEPPAKASPAADEREILRLTQQWFEAHFAGNAAGMHEIVSPEFTLADERAGEQRVVPTMRGVERGLQQVRIEVAGDGAVMSARLVERIAAEGQFRELVSLVSGVWIRVDGQWRLAGLRFVSPPGLGL